MRPKSDSAIDQAKANPKRPHRESDRVDAEAPPGSPERPKDLKGRALQIWFETISVMSQIRGLLTIADGPPIADFCRVAAQKEMIEAGMEAEVTAAVKKAKAEAKLAHDEALKTDPKAKLVKPNVEIITGGIYFQYQGVLDKLRMRQLSLTNTIGRSPASRSQIKVQAPGYVPGLGTTAAAKARNLVSDPVLGGGSAGLQKFQ
jgi:hypothetical protein